MIAIIDYGMGNIHSVQKALQLKGAQTLVTSKPEDIRASEKVVLPGVGAFNDAMKELIKQGLVPAILEHLKQKKPFLGICLGMQILFEESQEAIEEKGLGVLKGKVIRFEEGLGLKVPHMGWNRLRQENSGCPLLKDLPEEAFVYFCHSYYPKPSDDSVIAAATEYGIEFSSVVKKDNIYGVQFHPEKSQAVGLKILENFIKLC